ncbi:paraquat-inducible membrane protein A [Vibrio albus]|uniref:Paraquat-inducible membrane protein A n=1 Tax=Vibrio albus TaxID=2200953 RepID=A0A2U3BBM1_9VIBR|nr:paraquat-inducible protein A [Vibrio albus]PWI34177.1 paraquat-inducible membrane protein A [Vibrio albus]
MSTQQHQQPVRKVRLCQGCELPVDLTPVPNGKSAYCPRCGTQLYRGGKHALSGNLALAITCLLLFIPSHLFPFINIRLIGVTFTATIPSGIYSLIQEGFPELAILVFFCSSLAPFAVCVSVVGAHIALRKRWFKVLKYSLTLSQCLKHWVMLDVFLAAIAISCFKLQDYADIQVDTGLYGLILLQIFILMLITRISVRRYWERWQPESTYSFEHKHVHCHHCHLSQPDGSHCLRCQKPLHHRKPYSVQKTWAYLIAATVAIFPANLIPISILFTNGQRLEDTILSGVASLITEGMQGIALIIFIASIIVPAAKILGIGCILIYLHFGKRNIRKQLMSVYFAVKWIGKWSVMDIFVISIMMTLVDRGRILNFTPGYGAIAFGAVVVLTMLATESFDPRLIWDGKSSSDKTKDTALEIIKD